MFQSCSVSSLISPAITLSDLPPPLTCCALLVHSVEQHQCAHSSETGEVMCAGLFLEEARRLVTTGTAQLVLTVCSGSEVVVHLIIITVLDVVICLLA